MATKKSGGLPADLDLGIDLDAAGASPAGTENSVD